MSFDQLTSGDKQKLRQFFDAGTKTLQEIADLQAGIKDVAKTLAEEFDVKPALLMKALKAAIKSDIDAQRDDMTTVETLLEAIGER